MYQFARATSTHIDQPTSQGGELGPRVSRGKTAPESSKKVVGDRFSTQSDLVVINLRASGQMLRIIGMEQITCFRKISSEFQILVPALREKCLLHALVAIVLEKLVRGSLLSHVPLRLQAFEHFL